jgi:hypothetical protein
MSNANEQLSGFLKGFPKLEIIEMLKEIDAKINSLHTISSKDFLFFNKVLKDYFSETKKIADANKEINLFIRERLSNVLHSIETKNIHQREYIYQSESYTSELSDKTSVLFSSFDLIVVPFNNYKQNLITLKYILANLRLHLSYVKVDNKENIDTETLRLEKEIDRILTICSLISDSTDKIVVELLDVRDAAHQAKESDSTDVHKYLNESEKNIKHLINHTNQQNSALISLNSRTQNCFSNLGEIITNIQYHDIIRQKMEHIQSSQRQLISELEKIDENYAGDFIELPLQFISKIPEVSDVQVAQLLYTNKDYQTSIEKITSKLIGVGIEMKSLSELYDSLFDFFKTIDNKFIPGITAHQNSYEEFVETFHNRWTTNLKKITNITILYTALKSEFNKVFNEEKELRTFISNLNKEVGKLKKGFGSELTKRLNSMITDLKLSSNTIKTNLNNITTHFSSLDHYKNKETKSSELTISKDLLGELTSSSKDVEGICSSFSEVSAKIASEITSSINSIEYYNFFKNIIEEIVQLLNKVNQSIDYDELKRIFGENTEVMAKLEKLYTMKSERDIHEKVSSGQTGIEQIFEETPEPDPDDMGDIELF